MPKKSAAAPSAAKRAALGAKPRARETASMKAAHDNETSDAPIPARKPLGQEDSEDEFDDVGDDLMEADNDAHDDDDLVIDPAGGSTADADAQDAGALDEGMRFAPASAAALAGPSDAGKTQLRKVPIPPHRLTPLKREWAKIYTPLVEQAGLMVRMNPRTKTVEMKVCRRSRAFTHSQTCEFTTEPGVLQKAADFVRAFALGFEADDALALLRLDDLYVDSFEIKDVKTLHGDHLSRAIGRIAGKDGRTRFAIENASRTRIVVADTKIHILGAFQNIRVARDSIVALIMGSPPGKVYAKLRTITSRMRQRA